MGERSGPGRQDVQVWRVGGWARPVVPLLTAACAVAAASRWISWLLSPSGPTAVQAGVTTAFALALGLLTRWTVLKPALEVRTAFEARRGGKAG